MPTAAVPSIDISSIAVEAANIICRLNKYSHVPVSKILPCMALFERVKHPMKAI
jgi:hypothetical protein